MNRTLSVALLTTADYWRGSGISFAKIARGLSERGHRVTLVVSSNALAAEYARLGIPARQLSLARTGAREVFALHAVVRENVTDVIIVDKPRDLRLAAMVSMLRPLRIVIRYNRVGTQPPARFVDRWTARCASAVLYQSDYIRQKALNDLPMLGELASFVIPNGFDAATIAANARPRAAWRAEHGVAEDELVVVSVGFAEAQKRFDQSIDALALLAARGIVATFVFCGDGPCREALEARARAGGVKSLWLGLQSPSDTLSAIAAADVLVHPCPVEIFGNVLAESMALETPIIAMRAGGNPEMLGDGGASAILVEEGSAESFAAAIAALLSDPLRRCSLAAAARERLASVLPQSRMIDEYDAMLQQVTAPPRGLA